MGATQSTTGMFSFSLVVVVVLVVTQLNNQQHHSQFTVWGIATIGCTNID